MPEVHLEPISQISPPQGLTERKVRPKEETLICTPLESRVSTKLIDIRGLKTIVDLVQGRAIRNSADAQVLVVTWRYLR